MSNTPLVCKYCEDEAPGQRQYSYSTAFKTHFPCFGCEYQTTCNKHVVEHAEAIGEHGRVACYWCRFSRPCHHVGCTKYNSEHLSASEQPLFPIPMHGRKDMEPCTEPLYFMQCKDHPYVPSRK